MRLIDEIHLKRPFYGSRRIRNDLQDLGHRVNRKKVQRLMRLMGIAALSEGEHQPAWQGAYDLPLPAEGPVH